MNIFLKLKEKNIQTKTKKKKKQSQTHFFWPCPSMYLHLGHSVVLLKQKKKIGQMDKISSYYLK